MSRSLRRFSFFLCLALAVLPVSAGAQPLADDAFTSGPGSFAAFSLIVQRNIFDPGRQPHEPREAEDVSAPVAESEPPDTVDLLGTWITEQQSILFTDGNLPELGGTLSLGAELDGYRIADVRPGYAILEGNGERLEWPVGHRLQRGQDDSTWIVAGKAAIRVRDTPSTATTTSGSAATTSGDEGDLIQQMRERRKREMGGN